MNQPWYVPAGDAIFRLHCPPPCQPGFNAAHPEVLFFMLKRLYWLVIVVFFSGGCVASDGATPTAVPAAELAPTPFPTIQVEVYDIPVTDEAGGVIARQPGPLWVLVSGVDEHGLIAEHELALLNAPDASAVSETVIHTGSPAAVQEIRHTGPQNLQRFYRIQSPTGPAGWISDFYIRRVAYLFNSEGTTVPLFESPGGNEIARLEDVTPVLLLSPLTTWWKVETADNKLTGWVPVNYVKESPEPEYLLNQQHEHH